MKKDMKKDLYFGVPLVVLLVVWGIVFVHSLGNLGKCLDDRYNVPTVEADIDLPVEAQVAPIDDSADLHLSIVGSRRSREYQKLVRWFDRNRELNDFRKGVKYHAVTTTSPLYNDRYRPNVQGLPTVRLQDAQGVVLYEVAGQDVPASESSLLSAMVRAVEKLAGNRFKCDPNRRGCPNRKEAPAPEVTPFVEPEALVEPESEQEPEQSNTLPILLGLGGAAAAGVAGARKKLKAA